MTIFSTDRILVTHAGSLPRPSDVRDMVLAKSRGQPVDQAALAKRLDAAVAEVVRKQVQCGIDSVNDGELSKSNFTDYVRARISGYETRPATTARRLEITARDATKFAAYFEANPRARFPGAPTIPVCVAPLKYVGQADLKQDIDRFKAALEGRHRGRSLPARQHARHHRALDGERALQERRGIRLRHRRRDARGIPGDRRCRAALADRRSRPAGRLELPAQDDRARVPQIRDRAGRCLEPRAPRHRARKGAAPCVLGQLPRAAPRRHPLEGHHRHHLPRRCRQLFDRGVKSVPRA